MSVQSFIVKAWQNSSKRLYILTPLSFVFYIVSSVRKVILQSIYQGIPNKVPVIVVGNLNIGGSGKTPSVIAIVNSLKIKGFTPGVVSRGYGGTSKNYPLIVQGDSKYSECGDEPLLIYKTCNCPVVVSPSRRQAIEKLLINFECDVIISDDGLQHYSMHRDIEIAVFNADANFGNQMLFPSGPLREPIQRLKTIDYFISYGNLDSKIASRFENISCHNVKHEIIGLRNISTGKFVLVDDWSLSKEIHLIAGIAYPEKVLKTLLSYGFSGDILSLDDHQPVTQEDLVFKDDLPIFITEKDAVKLNGDIPQNVWSIKTCVKLSDEFTKDLERKITKLRCK